MGVAIAVGATFAVVAARVPVAIILAVIGLAVLAGLAAGLLGFAAATSG
jgi:hypothetical protein